MAEKRTTYKLQDVGGIGEVKIADEVVTVIAGLAAEGYTTVTQIGYIQRGYERFDEKLRALGGLIEKVDSEKETNKFIYKTGTVN